MKTYASMLLFVIIFTVDACVDPATKESLKFFQDKVKGEQDNMEIVKTFYRSLDLQDSVSAAEILHPDFQFYFGSVQEPLKYDALKPLIRSVYAAFPDFNHKIDILFASGEWVASKQQYTGTHTQPYFGIAPTGKKISYHGIFLFRIVDGKIHDIHAFEDDLSALIKKGLTS